MIISEYIVIHHPTLEEICNYGEHEYYSMIHCLTATPQTMKSELWDMQPRIDYTKITAFELFCNMICSFYSQEKTAIIFGALDMTRFNIAQKENSDELILYQIIDNKSIIIDESTYTMIMDYLRKIHFIEKDDKIPANDTTKMILIEDAREARIANQNKKPHSQLKNMISGMVNSEGFKYDHSSVWNMKINSFMDSVHRILKIKNANLLLQSGYSGFGVNLKEISTKQLDWLGELD